MRTVDIFFLATVAINRSGSLAHVGHCLPPVSIRVSCSNLDVLMHSILPEEWTLYAKDM